MKQCKCGSYAFNLYKEDIDQGDLCDVHYWKEKALAQPEQEPVAWVHAGALEAMINSGDGYTHIYPSKQIGASVPLYTTPPQRKPLTPERINLLWYEVKGLSEPFARAIEAAHVIKE